MFFFFGYFKFFDAAKLWHGPDNSHDGFNKRYSPVIEVFKTALLDQTLINEERQAKSDLGKRALPGDLVVAANGWGAITYPKNFWMHNPRCTRPLGTPNSSNPHKIEGSTQYPV